MRSSMLPRANLLWVTTKTSGALSFILTGLSIREWVASRAVEETMFSSYRRATYLSSRTPTEHSPFAGTLTFCFAVLAIAAGWGIGSMVYGIQLSTVPAIGLHSGVWTEIILFPLLLLQLFLLFVSFRWSSNPQTPSGPMRWQNLME